MIEENVKGQRENKTILQQKIDSFELLFGFKPEITNRHDGFNIYFNIKGQGKGIMLDLLGDCSEERKLEAFEACLRRAKTILFYD